MSDERVLKPKAVLQYELNGTFIKEYPSVYHAAKSIKGNQSNISACCIGRQKKAYGFQWRFKEDPGDIPVEKIRGKVICQYSLDGEKIAEHSSVREAAGSLSKKEKDKPMNVLCSGVFACCKRGRGKAYGYQWRFKDDVGDKESIDIYKRTLSTTVICSTLNGKDVAVYGSLMDAATAMLKGSSKREISTGANNIARHCKNGIPIYGYLWRKVDD